MLFRESFSALNSGINPRLSLSDTNIRADFIYSIGASSGVSGVGSSISGVSTFGSSSIKKIIVFVVLDLFSDLFLFAFFLFCHFFKPKILGNKTFFTISGTSPTFNPRTTFDAEFHILSANVWNFLAQLHKYPLPSKNKRVAQNIWSCSE